MESTTPQKPLYGCVIGGKKIKGLLLVMAFEMLAPLRPSSFLNMEGTAQETDFLLSSSAACSCIGGNLRGFAWAPR